MGEPLTPRDELSLLKMAALEAGAVAAAAFRQGAAPNARVWQKSDQTPVTEADLAVNQTLRDILRPARPLYGWLSEEDADDVSRLNDERIFIVDPIDGTRAFAAGEPDFCISIAIVENGAPVAGVVYAPIRNDLFCAARGLGAQHNERPLSTSPGVALTGSRTQIRLDALASDRWLGGSPDILRSRYRSTALAGCFVASGASDALISLRKVHEWDLAAAAIIASETGVDFSDSRGAPIDFNRRDPVFDGLILAAEPLKLEILSRLR